MERFTAAIRRSLQERNWYSALYLSLSLPDMCASLSSKDGITSGKLYAQWFESNLSEKYTHEIGLDKKRTVFLSGSDCYALRCALLHNGKPDIEGQSAQKIRDVLSLFHFTIHGYHLNKFDRVMQLDVQRFCLDVCEAVEKWSQQFKKTDPAAAEKLGAILLIDEGETSVGLVTFGVPSGT